MAEVLWPPDLTPSAQTWNILGNAASFVSPLNGATRTYGRPGVRMGCTITLPPINGQNRARMLALLAALKDRSNRILVPDFTIGARGSFAATELLSNNDFSGGTTGWTAENCALSASDYVLRLTNTKAAGAATFNVSQTGKTVTAYAPYALRSFISTVSRSGLSSGTSWETTNYATDRAGSVSQLVVPSSGTTGNIYPGVFDSTGNLSIAGDFAELSWTSVARCIAVDGGPNAWTQSDDFSHADWTTKNLVTVSANTGLATAPDGTSTADRIIATASSGLHYLSRGITAPAAATDICICVAVRANAYNYCWLGVSNGTNEAYQVFNLSTGAVGTATTTETNFSNLRAFVVNMGDGWRMCCIVVRKTNSATSLTGFIGTTNADSRSSFTGDDDSGMVLWRGTAALSSLPVRLTQTTSSATTGESQTGTSIHVKGLPASTSGLLLAGDMVEIDRQVNYVIAPLNSDAAGRGLLVCGNPFRVTTNDTPIHVNTPMCKMLLSPDQIDIDTMPGRFSPVTLELVEAID